MSLADVIINEYLNENNDLEPINEFRCAMMNGLCIDVDPDTGRNFGNGIAYFKCSNSKNINTAKVARISFFEPKYIIHYKDSSKNRFKLSPNQKDTLMKMINSKTKEGELVWHKMINAFNDFLDASTNPNASKFKLPLDLPIPDYTKL